MDLINGELEAGGKVADVIDRVIMDLKKTRMLKEEMAASTLTYMIFIAALVMFVMPLLFALSFVLFNVITGFIGNIAANTASSPIAMLKLSSSGVSAEDYKIFTVLAITIISCASAFIVSIIEKGDIISGLKYVPMFWLTSLFMYFLFLSSIGGLFGSVVKFGG